MLVFYHAGRKLIGTLTLKGDEKGPIVAKLGPAAAVKGRLLDSDGNPLSGVVVGVHYRRRAASESHNIIYHAKEIVTDAKGAFRIDDLISDQKLEYSFHSGKRKFERTPRLVNPAVEVKAGECRDVGALKVKRTPESMEE
ncbi:MAG: carboxypeptidase-like regulatory domain-containing protein [Gemmataceae bacterium]